MVSFLSSTCAILFGFAAFLNSNKKDGKDKGREDGALLTEIGYIKAGIDDIRKKQERQDENYIKLLDRVANIEQISKDAQRRIKVLEEEKICR